MSKDLNDRINFISLYNRQELKQNKEIDVEIVKLFSCNIVALSPKLTFKALTATAPWLQKMIRI